MPKADEPLQAVLVSNRGRGWRLSRRLGAGWDDAVVVEMSAEEFERLVEDALDQVPAELAAMVENLVVLVQSQAPADDPDLLGLYDGVALPDQDSHYGMQPPAQILIFSDNLLQMCASREEVEEEVRITVVHEIAHHFGIDDDRLHDLGYA